MIVSIPQRCQAPSVCFMAVNGRRPRLPARHPTSFVLFARRVRFRPAIQHSTMSSAIEHRLAKYRQRALEVIKFERQRISDMRKELEGQEVVVEPSQEAAGAAGGAFPELETEEAVLSKRLAFHGEESCWTSCLMHGTGGQALATALLVSGSQQLGAGDREKARIQATTGEQAARGGTNQLNRVGSSCCKLVSSEEALAAVENAPMLKHIRGLFGNCVSLSIPRSYATGTGSRCSLSSEIDAIPVILIGDNTGKVVKPSMYLGVIGGALDLFEFVPQRLNVRVVLVENVDQKLLILSILQILREQAGVEERKRLDIRVISLPETSLINAAGEEAMITVAADAKAQIWDKAAVDLSSVTAEELAMAEAFQQKLLELKELGEHFDKDSAAAAWLRDAQHGILVKPVEPMEETLEGSGKHTQLPAIPGMVHVAFTTVGDLFVSCKQAAAGSSHCASLLAYEQLEAAGALDLSVRHPPLEKVAAEVETETSWLPETAEELEEMKAKVAPAMASMFKTKAVRQRELTAEKNAQLVERMKVEELRLGAACLRFCERKLEGRSAESITPSCKSGLRFDAVKNELSDDGSVELDDVPVAVLGLAIGAKVDQRRAYCGICSAYTPALGPITHVFAKNPEQVRQVLALTGSATQGIAVGGIEDLRRLRAGLDQFRGQPYTDCANIAVVDSLLGAEPARGTTLTRLLGDSEE